MKILVMGAGAMGSAVGGFMAAAGHDVCLVGRDEHMGAVAARGLRITGIWGERLVTTLHAVTRASLAPIPAYDLVLICVKSYDTEPAVRAAQHLLSEDGLACSYQNGLGNLECMAALLGPDRIIGARAIYGARITMPGTVDITVIAEPTALGAYGPRIPQSRLREIAAAMNDAGVPTVYAERIQTLIWNKVAYNCALNPLSALLDVPYGRLAENEYSRTMMEEVIQELYLVGEGMQAPLHPDNAADYIALFYEKLLPPTAAHYASMREDLRRGRRTEIDALNGAVARFGSTLGLPCPANTLLTRLVHAREAVAG